MKTIYLSAICAGARLLSADAFAPSRPDRRNGFSSSISSSVLESASAEGGGSADASPASPPPPSGGGAAAPDRNKPNWEVKQHLYGLDMARGGDNMSVTVGSDGAVEGSESLPLPETYITCGRCKALFAISEEDLGPRGKGW